MASSSSCDHRKDSMTDGPLTRIAHPTGDRREQSQCARNAESYRVPGHLGFSVCHRSLFFLFASSFRCLHARHNCRVVILSFSSCTKPDPMNRYSMWNATVADFWRSSGPRKEVWAYHCISPRPAIAKDGRIGPMRWLNSFVESKAMESRLLMWWGAGVDATGWLYWFVTPVPVWRVP